jgi:hypothetical protein
MSEHSDSNLGNEIFGTLTSTSSSENKETSSSLKNVQNTNNSNSNSDNDNDNDKNDVKEVLNEYFKLKQKYENLIMVNKKKIINNTNLSKREKRSEYLKLKPKCINCSRPGGTKFITKFFPETDSDDSYREYSAICGIIANPCNLNIKIQIGSTQSLPSILNNYQTEIKNLKDKVIDDKNKLLFGFIKTEDVLESFEKLKEDINIFSSYYEFQLESYNFIVDNDDKKLELNESITNSYIQINQIKDCIKKMNETNNIQFAKDAVNIYVNILKPLLDKIRYLKYNEYSVFKNEDSNTCNLVQNKFSIENLLYSGFKSKVISNIFGGDVMSGVKKGLIVMNDLSSTTSSTPEEQNNTIQKALPTTLQPVVKNIPKDEPEYGKGKDGISWHIPEYNNLWDTLPLKLKNVLRQDKDWMVEFMFNCVNAKAKREPCQFTPPPDLKIPPEEMPNGQYNFGVEIYTNEFNKLPKTLQATYLSQYSTKDGVKNYNMLKNSMNDLVAKALDFGRGFF